MLRDVAGTEAVLDEPSRKVAGEQLVDVLAAIHRVDVDAVGLGDFARRDGYIERQLRRWHGQFGKSQEQAKEIGVYRPVPLVDEVHKILTDRLPAQHGTAIVHGDYRLDNTIMSAGGRIMAVLDWELCTLGDPLADVGTLLAYWAEDQGTATPSPAVVTMAQSAATGLPGLPDPRRGRRSLRGEFGAGPGGHRLLRRVRVLEAGLHPGGRVRPLRGQRDGNRLIRRGPPGSGGRRPRPPGARGPSVLTANPNGRCQMYADRG